MSHARGDQEDLVILAFSGGTRGAAFAYTTRSGGKTRMLGEVDVITGVSGGSFTALG